VDVIVVDNGSKDETPTELALWAARAPRRRVVIANEGNLGFGGAVNQGLALATGDFLVVLNNDTIVSPGWARGLRRHLENDAGLGIVCPITNNIGNEAQVVLSGTTPAEVFAAARRYSLPRAGQTFALTIAAFFCVMMPRAVYARIGNLDEQFFPGYFEDDDYCLRVKAAGWRVACAEDVFVYHELSASFNQEGAARRHAIFTRNKALFEAKWGPWTPHVYR
jgi:GT2 family glycosyltransferase